jgi:hypothetical protein
LPVAALSVAAERKNSNALLAADDKQRLLDLEQEWVTAENRHDASTLRRILQEKFVAPVPDRRNQCDKEAFIREIVGSDVDPVASQTLGRVAPQNEPLCGRQFVLNRKHSRMRPSVCKAADEQFADFDGGSEQTVL